MKKKGFTLIELLAIIVVIGIVALIAIPNVLNVIENSQKKAFLLDSRNIFNIVNQYVTDSGISGRFTINNGKASVDGMEIPTSDLKIEKTQYTGYVEIIDNSFSSAIYGDRWCAVRNANDNEYHLFELNTDECNDAR